MKKIIFRLFLLIFILASALYANEAEHDMKYLFKKIYYQVKEDGTIIKEYHHKLKLYTYKSVSRLAGETFIKYNPKYQKLEIIKSQTTMKSGIKIDSPKNAYNEVLPRVAHGFHIYSDLKEMVISHTGLERGATIELHYKLTTKPNFYPYFSALEDINNQYPIDDYFLEVSASKGIEASIINGFNGAEIDRKENSFSIKASKIKEISVEPQSFGQKSMVLLGLKDEKKELPALIKGEFPPCVKTKLKKLREKSPDNLAYIKDALDYFKDILSDCKVPLSLNSYNLRSPQKIIDSAYALGIEKVLLLQKALSLFGIETSIAGEARFFLSTPLSVGDIHIYEPNILIFEENNFFSINKKRLLGESEKSNIFIWGKNSLAEFNENIPSDNVLKIKTLLYGDRKEGKAYFSSKGIFTNYIGEPNKVKSVLKGKLGQIFPYLNFYEIKITDIMNGEINGEVKVNLKNDKADYLDITTLSVPFSKNILALEKRENDLRLSYPCKIENTIILDEAMSKRIEYNLQDKVEKNNKFGKTYIEILKSDNRVTLKEFVEIKEKFVSNQDYLLFKDLIIDFCNGETLFYIKNIKKEDKKEKGKNK